MISLTFSGSPGEIHYSTVVIKIKPNMTTSRASRTSALKHEGN